MGVAIAAVTSTTVFAQAAYPSRPVRLVVSQAPGGSSDTIARMWAEHAGKALGGTIVVENKPGAGGLIAAQNALNAPADGYTLLFGSVSLMVLNQFTYKPLPYNPEKDFTGVAMLTTVPFVLSTNPATGIKTLKDLTDRAKAAPGKLNFASAGLGNSTHLAVELLADAAGISMTHIPYKGEADGVMATMGGQTEVMAPVYGTALPHIKNGKLNPLAVLSPQRTPDLPDVPTLGELGVKGFDNMGWSAVVARSGTPADIVEKLNKATEAFHSNPAVQTKLKTMGVMPVAGPSTLVMETTVRDTKAWGPALEKLNLSAK
ncbi:Bug family tripartite tricarboxylate transporter substrate binding protein [Acidovorax sp.]|uniref:Bug family tripartite tricarboxylate transporter substrate binding protein n=2 Tax=Acidovorax TaxID=12916 RepID=UPI003BB10A20